MAVKNYGFEWSTRFGLTDVEVAGRIASHGFDQVLVQNLIDPLPTSAVEQEPPAGAYDERRFRDALRDHGLRVYESTSVFFQPATFEARPDLRPVDAQGRTMRRVGWYAGLCPSSPEYLAGKAALLDEVVTSLDADGLFLSFIRFPNFWELWMPETSRAEIDEYCFCPRCLALFADATGHALPDRPVPEVATLIQQELRADWTRWKCGVIADCVARLEAAAVRSRPGLEVMINGFGLGASDYGNAVEEVLGQDIELLSAHAEHFELMFYHQILRREPMSWIARVVAETRPRTDRTLLACVQGSADYLDPMYAPGRRSPTIPIDEFRRALRAVLDSEADGLMLYHWNDVLVDEEAGDGSMVRALCDFKAGTLGQAGTLG
jgi:hypothetical protein